MTASRLSVVWVCFWIAGCGGGCGGALEATEDGVVTEQGAQSTDEGSDPGAETTEPVEPGPRPVLRVVGEPAAHGSSVAIRIENRGTESVELAGVIGLQREESGAFGDVEVNLDLRYSCEDEAPECVTLAPGGTYLPPPWLGTRGDAQCDCQRCASAAPGTYRFLVRSCNGAHTIEGEPFEMQAE